MDTQGFSKYLKREGRVDHVIQEVVKIVGDYTQYLQVYQGIEDPDAAQVKDLEAYVAHIEHTPKTSAKTHLWGLCYYYKFTGNDELRRAASTLREARLTRTPFPLKDFQAGNAECLKQLAAAGIRNVDQMLAAGKTPAERKTLAERSRVPVEIIEEFIKLSDLARLPGVKGIRARLYFEAGVDTVEKMAEWDPEALRMMLADFVERTGFDGIAPLPKEVESTIATARKLPKVVVF